MLLIIDRFESNFAVCEDENRNMIDIGIEKLPKGVKEGDVIKLQGEKISFEAEETEKRRAYIKTFIYRKLLKFRSILLQHIH